ncbi:phosphatidate cytidylyltransferase [bacterium]|nr:phosphatidate cytidylyltransferase [bacterium]
MTGFFKSRTFLFIWGIPVVVATIWFGGWYFVAGISVLSVVASLETMKVLAAGKATWGEKLLVGGLCAVLPFAIALHGLIALLWLYIAGLLGAGSLALLRKPEDGFRFLIAATFTMFYIGLPFTSALLLRLDPIWQTHFQGAAIIVYIWAGVWVTDTFAYLGGRRFGKRPLAPQLSPKKTLEGTASGILMALVWTILAGFALTDVLSWWDRILLGAIIGMLSVIGDLVESMLKRVAHVKDSGTILHGHGGVLDRFDSLLFVQPAVYLYLIAADVLNSPSVPLLG